MDYKSLLKKIEKYRQKYIVYSIGKSNLNREIYAVEIRKNISFSTAFLIASIHARENITTDLLCKMIDEKLFDEIENFNVILVLMANPDGVELSNFGLRSVPTCLRKKLLKINNNSLDFSLWKANINGVDLNNNFDANFGTNIGSTIFASSGYCGEHFESEVETKSLVKFTKMIRPFFTISYHSKGEEIYYNFFQEKNELERDMLIANKFSESTGYVIKNPEKTSSGGYKDYCISKLKIPSITIEIGSDELSHPISKKYLGEIFEKHKSIAKDLNFAYNVCTNLKN